MKIFALLQDMLRRTGKDIPDIAYLCELNDLNLEKDIHPLCDRFGTREVYEAVWRQVEGLRES